MKLIIHTKAELLKMIQVACNRDITDFELAFDNKGTIIPAHIAKSYADGNRVAAIIEFRKYSGLGLYEAKVAMEKNYERFSS
jgi:ribosomal protein L7/L12